MNESNEYLQLLHDTNDNIDVLLECDDEFGERLIETQVYIKRKIELENNKNEQ